MGTPSYATTILKALMEAEDIDVVGLVTQPDKPVGRKQVLTPPDTKRYLLETEAEIDICQPKTLRSEESQAWIRAKNPDFIVVAAFGQILPKEVLDIAPCINLHASILPKYRGASPIQSAILAGEKYSGVTSMLMDVGLDTGDMLGFSILGIGGMDAATLFEKLSVMAADLACRTLRNFYRIQPIPQLDCESSYAKKITKEDGLVTCKDAATVWAKYLAFIFWPGIYLQSGLKLKKIALVEQEARHNVCEILAVEEACIVVGCGKGTIRVYTVQSPSKKAMGAVDYIRGKRIGVGDILA